MLINSTVDSRYYDTAGTTKKYQYIQTIHISNTKFNCLQVIGTLKRYHNKQYFDISDILITRDHCRGTFLLRQNCTTWERSKQKKIMETLNCSQHQGDENKTNVGKIG